MEREKFKSHKIIFLILLILYCIGIVLHFISSFNHYLKFLNPIFLVTVFLIVTVDKSVEKKFITWVIMSYLITLSIEILGVHTGLIFGSYQYGNNLGVKLSGVPIVIGLNWITLLLGSIGYASMVKTSVYLKSFISSILMVGFDGILELVASKLNYWFWRDDIIPYQNFIAWFLISYILSYFYYVLVPGKNLILAKYNYIIQFLFFVILYIFLH